VSSQLNLLLFSSISWCTIYDATISHTKKKISNSMINIGITIKISEQIITEVRKLNNYTITQTIIAKESFLVTTLVELENISNF
jgi:hypothetical protein